jgi:hypothetical protein
VDASRLAAAKQRQVERVREIVAAALTPAPVLRGTRP